MSEYFPEFPRIMHLLETPCSILVVSHRMHDSNYSIKVCASSEDEWVCGSTLLLSLKPVILNCEEGFVSVVSSNKGEFYVSITECDDAVWRLLASREPFCSIVLEVDLINIMGFTDGFNGFSLNVMLGVTVKNNISTMSSSSGSIDTTRLTKAFKASLLEPYHGKVCVDLTEAFSDVLERWNPWRVVRGNKKIIWCLITRDVSILKSCPVRVLDPDNTKSPCFHLGLCLRGSRNNYHLIKYEVGLHELVEGRLVVRFSRSIESIVASLSSLVFVHNTGRTGRDLCYNISSTCSVRLVGWRLCFTHSKILGGEYACSINHNNSVVLFDNCISISQVFTVGSKYVDVFCVEKSFGAECSYTIDLVHLVTLLLMYAHVVGHKLFELVEDVRPYLIDVWQFFD